MLSNSCHGNHTKDFLLTFNFMRPTILQNLTFVQLWVDEIVGIMCGSKIAWYKKG